MKLKILSFWWNSFETREAISFTTTTKSWEITVLDKHEALITALVPSTIKIIYKENNQEQEKNFAIWKGIIEISDSEVKILTDMLVKPENLEKWELEKAIKEAKKLKEKYAKSANKEDMEKFIQASEQLSKVQAKVKLVELSK